MINLRYTSLGQMLLADALRRVVFTPEDVRQAILLAKRESYAPVGHSARQSRTLIQVHPVLTIKPGIVSLTVCAFKNAHNLGKVESTPAFTAVLITAANQILSSSHHWYVAPRGASFEVIALANPGDLTGAHLELVR